jgi:hypothetical protein
MLRKFSLLALLLAAPLAYAQSTSTTATPVWSTVAGEDYYTSVTLPAGATYRLGDSTHNLWSAPITVTVATTFDHTNYPSNVYPFADPDPGTGKELDVLEISSQQMVTLTNIGATPATTVQQIVPAIIPPVTIPVPVGTSHTLTFSNFTTPEAAGQNALMFAFVNAPSNLANRTWEGTQMSLNIDGVVMTCTYGQTYTDGVFTLSCSVPASTSTTTTPSGQ